MKKTSLVLSALLALSGTAAQAGELYTPEQYQSVSASTTTRAEVRQELARARAMRQLTFGEVALPDPAAEISFVGVDARLDLGVMSLLHALLVQLFERADEVALGIGRDSRWAVEVQDWRALTTKRNALVGGGNEATRPERVPPAWAARTRLQHDESRQVFRLTPQSIRDP